MMMLMFACWIAEPSIEFEGHRIFDNMVWHEPVESRYSRRCCSVIQAEVSPAFDPTYAGALNVSSNRPPKTRNHTACEPDLFGTI
jgi:hypothetical protein